MPPPSAASNGSDARTPLATEKARTMADEKTYADAMNCARPDSIAAVLEGSLRLWANHLSCWPNSAGFRHYSPVAQFFIEDAERRGDHVRLLTTTADLPVNAFVLSCDPHMRQWLASQGPFVTILSDDHYAFGSLAQTSDHHVAVD